MRVSPLLRRYPVLGIVVYEGSSVKGVRLMYNFNFSGTETADRFKEQVRTVLLVLLGFIFYLSYFIYD